MPVGVKRQPFAGFAVARALGSFLEKPRGISLSLFLAVTLAFWIPRIHLPVTVTDTEYLGAFWRLGWSQFVDVLKGVTVARWYRPVETVIIYKLQESFGNDFVPMMLLNSAITGSIAVLVYLTGAELAQRELHRKQAQFIGILAALLFVFSVPMIETTWLFMHKSVMSDLFMVLGVYAFIRYELAAHLRESWGWLGLLILSGVMAPWTRETAAALPLVLLITTIVGGRRDWKLGVTLLVLTFHAFYPTFFMTLAFQHQLSFLSLFDRASGGVSGLSAAQRTFMSLPVTIQNPDVPYRLALYLSPLAAVAILASIALHYQNSNGPRILGYRLASVVAILVLLISLIAIYSGHTNNLLPLLFAAFIGVPSYRRFGPLLVLWAIVPAAPMFFFRAFDAWLKPSAVPFVILALLWVFSLPSLLSDNAPRLPFARGNRPYLIVGVCCVVLLSSVLSNMMMAYSTFQAAGTTHQRIAATLLNQAGTHAFVSNLRQTRDVAFFTDDKVKAYLAYYEPYFPPAGGRDPLLHSLAKDIDKYQRLYFLVNDKFGWEGFGKLFRDRHANDLERISGFRASAHYPVLDPFMWALPPKYRKFGGPSDLLHNFDIKVIPFVGNASASYSVYRYTGHTMALVDTLHAQDVLPRDGLIESHRGFNIIGYLGQFVAIPLGEGIFDFRRCTPQATGAYSACYVNQHISNVRSAIDRHVTPQFLQDDYKGLSIWMSKGKYYAIPRQENPFSERFCQPGRYSVCLQSDTFTRVRTLVDQRVQPRLVRESDSGFNIIEYAYRFYALPPDEGAFDYERLQKRNYRIALVADSLEDLEILVRHFRGTRAKPDRRHSVHATYRRFNFVAFGTKLFAIPQDEGAFDVDKFNAGKYSSGFVGDTITELRRLVDAASGTRDRKP